MRFKKFQNLQEKHNYSRMVPAEWNKPAAKNSPGKGRHRIDILIQLIQNNEAIPLAKSGNIRIQSTPDLIKRLTDKKAANVFDNIDKEAIPFVAKDGKSYTLSDIGKSPIFGGGSGSGGGTKNTARNESHQCCMCQAMLDHGIHDIEFFTTDIIKDAYKKVKVDTSLKTILETPDNWIKSSYLSAKILLTSPKPYINKTHIFHRGDRVMKKIYKLKDKAFINTDMSELKDDKWNPGDIWAIEKGFDLKDLDTSNIKAFNDSLLELFFARKVVAISLKGTDKDRPPIGDYNIDDGRHPVKIRYKASYLDSKGGTFWSSKGSEIEYTDGRLVLKDNSPGANVKAEIKGESAKGGGISWGGKRDTGMIDYVKENLGITLPKHAGGVRREAKDIIRGDEEATKNFYKMFNHFFNNITEENFLIEIEKLRKKRQWTWVSAKLGSLYICYSLDTAGAPKADACITDFVNYAGSTKKESGPYVKIGK